jgi:hypothetical protein
MSITRDILRTWRAHRTVVQEHLTRGRSEAFVFTFLFVFLILAFLAQYPRAAYNVQFDPQIPLAAVLLGKAYGLLLFIPFAYGLAALSHLVARGLGAKGGTWYGARLAMFWSLVACTPLLLLQGLTFGIIGPGAQSLLVGVLALTAFVVFWTLAMIEVYANAP